MFHKSSTLFFHPSGTCSRPTWNNAVNALCLSFQALPGDGMGKECCTETICGWDCSSDSSLFCLPFCWIADTKIQPRVFQGLFLHASDDFCGELLYLINTAIPESQIILI